MDFQANGCFRMSVSVINITIVAFLEPAGIDATDAPMRFGNDSDAFRQVDGGLAGAAVKGDIVVVLGHTAKIDSHFADAHMDIQAPQSQIADIQTAFANSEVYDQIQRF